MKLYDKDKATAARARMKARNADPNSFVNRLDRTSKNLDKASKSMNKAGNWGIKKITLPIILFILGAVTFPIGIIFWLIAIFLISS